MLFKRKEKSTDTNICPDRYLLHISDVCFFLIASLEVMSLVRRIINALFLISSKGSHISYHVFLFATESG